jgi:hypothetical protein
MALGPLSTWKIKSRDDNALATISRQVVTELSTRTMYLKTAAIQIEPAWWIISEGGVAIRGHLDLCCLYARLLRFQESKKRD